MTQTGSDQTGSAKRTGQANDNQLDEGYSQPRVPPATPPVIDPAADPLDAAELADERGDSAHSGSVRSSVDRGNEDQEISPGETPDETAPDEGDITEPRSPDEIGTEGGDTIEPDRAPMETPPPPD